MKEHCASHPWFAQCVVSVASIPRSTCGAVHPCMARLLIQANLHDVSTSCWQTVSPIGMRVTKNRSGCLRWLGIAQERPSSLRLMTAECLINGSDPSLATTRPAVKQRGGQSSTRLGGQVDQTIQVINKVTYDHPVSQARATLLARR